MACAKRCFRPETEFDESCSFVAHLAQRCTLYWRELAQFHDVHELQSRVIAARALLMAAANQMSNTRPTAFEAVCTRVTPREVLR